MEPERGLRMELEVVEHDAPESAHLPNAPVVVKQEAVVSTPALTVEQLIERRGSIIEVMERVMVDGVHYGVVTGVQKPSLLKPGAEMLCNLFQLAPTYPDERQHIVHADDGHLDAQTLCVLRHIPTGLSVAEGMGFCTSREKKYAYRGGQLTCPACNSQYVRKSKQAGKDEYYCWNNPSRDQHGCGAVFPAGSEEYEDLAQQQKDAKARVPNPDLPDTFNTVLKMSAKRSLVGATLNATGASDVFTQDVEDTDDDASTGEGRAARQQQGKAKTSRQREKQPRFKDMAEITNAIVGLFEGIEDDGRAWIVAIVEEHYNKPRAELTADEKRDAGARLVRAYDNLVALRQRENNDFLLMAKPREKIAQCFADAFDGKLVFGPEWRISPDETNLPPRVGDTDEAEPAEGEVVAEGGDALADAEAERIANDIFDGRG